MQIITKAEARAKGLKFFYTGPCRNGHDAERYVSAGACVECLKTWQVGNRAKMRGYSASYRERNPEYERDYRRRNRDQMLAYERAYRERDPDKWRAYDIQYGRRYRQENAERVREYEARYRQENRGRCNA